jgi:hypothetical protein
VGVVCGRRGRVERGKALLKVEREGGIEEVGHDEAVDEEGSDLHPSRRPCMKAA